MIDIGDKVKWNGKKVGKEPIPDWLTTDMIGEVSTTYNGETYPYGVWFATNEGREFEVFAEGELVRA